MHRLYRLLAAILLLSYVSTGTAVIPGVLMTLAELDGSHQVVVRFTESGVQVLLHHREGEFTPEVHDHISKLARCLVCICELAPEGDHHLASMGVSGNFENSRDEMKRDLKEPSGLDVPAEAGRFFVVAPRPQFRLKTRTSFVHHQTGYCHRDIATVRLLI